jgi:hypothetical protein
MIYECKIDRKYLQKIPYDIIINHIIPYTYQIKPKPLLLDIISFKKDLDIIKNIYIFDYNFNILLHDLLLFCDDEFDKFHSNTSLKVKTMWGLLSIRQRTRFINNHIE